MANASKDVYDYIQAQGLATGWTLLRRRLVDTPATDQKAIVVSEDGGELAEMPAVAGLGSAPLASKGVLVTVRGLVNDAESSFLKANEILVALHGLRAVELAVGSLVYYGIRALTPEPVYAGEDDRGRPLHTVAFRLLSDAANL